MGESDGTDTDFALTLALVSSAGAGVRLHAPAPIDNASTTDTPSVAFVTAAHSH
jgi:hypothetical protein